MVANGYQASLAWDKCTGSLYLLVVSRICFGVKFLVLNLARVNFVTFRKSDHIELLLGLGCPARFPTWARNSPSSSPPGPRTRSPSASGSASSSALPCSVSAALFVPLSGSSFQSLTESLQPGRFYKQGCDNKSVTNDLLPKPLKYYHT